MADFTALKNTIETYIKQNGNEEITGNILQGVLLAMVETLGDSAINDLITALSNEVTARQNADGTLQTNITNEATARGNADTALGQRIDGEITNRENADTALGGRIDGVVASINAINTKLAEGYVYAGIATPSTNPSTPTGKVFYIATTAGTYTNFGGLVVTQGINILKFNGTAWSQEQVWEVNDAPIGGSDGLIKSGGVYKETRFLSRDYQCFQKYKADDSDVLIDTVGGNKIFASNFYRSILSMKLVGFNKTQPLKIGYMGRNVSGNYRIIFCAFNGSSWVRAFDGTLTNIESGNVGGICRWHYTYNYQGVYMEMDLMVDYSFLPNNYAAWVGGEQDDPSYIIKQECFEDDPVLVESNLEDGVISANIANPADIVGGQYVNNAGTISSGDNWSYIHIPVKQGKKVTFGGFILNRNGYFSIVDASDNVLTVSEIWDNDLPCTVTVPSGGVSLRIDIKTPNTPSGGYDNLMVNYGEKLLPKDTYKEAVTKIKGHELGDENMGNLEGRVTLLETEMSDALFESDLEEGVVSANIANPANIVDGQYVNNGGTISSGSGWGYIHIPVEQGKRVTFGGFILNRNAYFSIVDASDNVLSVEQFYDNDVPYTVTIPTGGVSLRIDIKTPYSPSGGYDNLMVNYGESLLPKDTYKVAVTKIKGHDLGGVDNGNLEGRVSLLESEVNDVFNTLVTDLPLSADGSGLNVGDAYINSSTGVLTVKLS